MLLFEVEKLEPGKVLKPNEIDSDDYEKIGYHFKLMTEAGLIEGTPECNGYIAIELCWAKGLKWAGHEFLDSIRAESAWEKVKSTVKEKGSALSYDAIKVVISHIPESVARFLR